jgi:S1-C subfamily serine protease
MKTLITILFLLLSSLNLVAGTISPNVSDEKYVEYGSKFTYVFKICGVDNKKELFCGSCVAINSEWVLTAAHVVKNAAHCGIHTDDNEVILIDEIVAHEDFETKFGIADIALCKLKKPLALSFYPQLYEKNDEVGKVCCIAGYGLTGTFLTGENNCDGKKRAGSNIIDGTEQDLLICSPSQRDKLTQLEFIIASGDSGGGLFIDGKLAGINSCVFSINGTPKSKYGDEAGHTRVSKFIPWILEIIKK